MVLADYYYKNPFFVIWLAYVFVPLGDLILPLSHKNVVSQH